MTTLNNIMLYQYNMNYKEFKTAERKLARTFETKSQTLLKTFRKGQAKLKTEYMETNNDE